MTATTNTFCRIIAPDVGHEWPEGRSNGGAQAQPHGHRCEKRRTAAEEEADGHGGKSSMGVCLKIYSDGNVHPEAWQSRKPEDFCSYGERREAKT